MPEKVAIFGGAGFVGSHLAHRLADLGYHVVILDNFMRGKREYISDLVTAGKASLIEGDIRNQKLVCDVVEGAKYVFHEAAVCINYSVAYPEESISVNVDGAFNVFKASAEAKVAKLVFASSASVYGNPQYLPMDEGHPFNPVTPYCAGKIACEYLLKVFAQKGLNYNVLRYFNVYGPRQNVDAYYTSVIINFMKQAQRGEPPIICGNGEQSMDFVNVHDVVEANVLAAESAVQGEAFNVGSGVSTSVKTLAETIIQVFGSETPPKYDAAKEVIVRRRQAGISKAVRMLGFKSQVSLEDGLGEVAEDMKKHPEYY